VRYKVHVIPGSKINQLVGFMDDGSLKIKIKAKPIVGKANRELIKFLADVLEIKASEVEIDSGFNSRDKIVRIWDVEKTRILQKLSS